MKWVPHLHDGLIVVKMGSVRSTTALLPTAPQRAVKS
jgi:hypothetical protein